MITKAIIKSTPALDGNKYTVYIPILRNANDSESDAIFEASLCYTSGIINSLKVDDVVFVSFEDNLYNKPVILGKLFKANSEDNITTQIIAKTLKVTENLDLQNKSNIQDTAIKEAEQSIEGLRKDIDSLK